LCGDKEIAPLLNGRIGYHSYWSDRIDGSCWSTASVWLRR